MSRIMRREGGRERSGSRRPGKSVGSFSLRSLLTTCRKTAAVKATEDAVADGLGPSSHLPRYVPTSLCYCHTNPELDQNRFLRIVGSVLLRQCASVHMLQHPIFPGSSCLL